MGSQAELGGAYVSLCNQTHPLDGANTLRGESFDFHLLNVSAAIPVLNRQPATVIKMSHNHESYRIFKEKFNLDKPILFTPAYLRGDIEQTIQDILNADGSVSLTRQIEAQNNMDDWGSYAVPGLLNCLTNCSTAEAKAKASQRLPINAQTKLLTEYINRDVGEEEEARQKAENKNIRKANRELKPWFYELPTEPTPEQQEAHTKRVAEVEQYWAAWWETNKAKWDYSAGEKVGIFFLDTRFAKYWSNLLRLDFGKSHIDKKPVLEPFLAIPITLAVSSVF